MINSVDAQVKAGKLLDSYRQNFEARFSESPMVDVGSAMEICKWLVHNVGYEKSLALLHAYFQLKDEWIEKMGYSLQWFKDNINKVIISSGLRNKGDFPVYVVAISESGRPVFSYNKFELKEYFHKGDSPYYYKPVLMSDWVKLSTEKKPQVKKEDLEAVGNDVGLWFLNWKEWGYSK